MAGSGGGRMSGTSCQVGHSFAVTALVAVPAAYLAVGGLTGEQSGGGPGFLLLFVAPLLLLPFAIGARAWATRGRTSLGWFGRAAAYYLAYYLAPIAVIYPLLPLALIRLYFDGFGASPIVEYLRLVVLFAVGFGGPVLVALLMVAPWTARGPRARAVARLVLGLLACALPAFEFLLAGLLVVPVLVAHIVFVCRVIPFPPDPDRAGAPIR